MNNLKCQSCSQYVPIVTCRECSLLLCFNCDERIHIKLENHNRSTLPFKYEQGGLPQEDQQNLIDLIQQKKQEIEDLKVQEQLMTKQYQEKMVQAKKKYETQIEALEGRLQKAQQYMNDVNLKLEGEANVDNLQNELEQLEKSLKLDIKQAEEEQRILLEKTQKVDSLLDRVKKATDIEQQQISKMNEVLNIFRACSEQLQKEKELLMLDNEKLVGEVEIFAKFFDQNGPLLEELSNSQNNGKNEQGNEQQ